MSYAGVAILVFLSLGGLLYLRRYFWSIRDGRPARAVQDQFGQVDIVVALLLAAFWIWIAWQQFHAPHPAVTTAGVISNSLFYFFLVIMIVGVLVGRGGNPIAIFGLRWSGWRQSLPGCLLALLAAYPLLLLVTALIQYLLGSTASAQDLVEFLKNSSSWKDRAIIGLLAIVCAPIAEEIMFRGYLYGVARQYLGRRIAMPLIALLFAAIHGHLPSLAGLFLFALLLALVYEKTGSLLATMTLHATFNAVTVSVTLLYPDLPS